MLIVELNTKKNKVFGIRVFLLMKGMAEILQKQKQGVVFMGKMSHSWIALDYLSSVFQDQYFHFIYQVKKCRILY